jgi:hypothetical protein
MFFPPWFWIAFLVLYLVGGAVLGVLIGWVSSSMLRLHPRSSWRDAAAGATAILVLFTLIAAATARDTTTIVNDQTLGTRGLLLNHVVVWAVGLIGLAVLGRQLVVAHRTRRVRDNAGPRLKASGPRQL